MPAEEGEEANGNTWTHETDYDHDGCQDGDEDPDDDGDGVLDDIDPIVWSSPPTYPSHYCEGEASDAACTTNDADGDVARITLLPFII